MPSYIYNCTGSESVTDEIDHVPNLLITFSNFLPAEEWKKHLSQQSKIISKILVDIKATGEELIEFAFQLRKSERRHQSLLILSAAAVVLESTPKNTIFISAPRSRFAAAGKQLQERCGIPGNYTQQQKSSYESPTATRKRGHSTGAERKAFSMRLQRSDKHPQTVSKEMHEFGHELQRDGLGQESILVYFGAAMMYRNEVYGKVALVGMHGCEARLKEASIRLVATDPGKKQLVKDHVIPLMREITNWMEQVVTDDDSLKCWKIVFALLAIVCCEDLVGAAPVVEEAYKEVFGRIEKSFPKDASKRWVYAWVFTEKGNLHKKRGDSQNATNCYKKAIDFYKRAVDVENETWRRERIKHCDEKLAE